MRTITKVCRELGVSQRKACQALGQARSTQRYEPKQPEKDKPLIKDILVLHVQHPRYGYRLAFTVGDLIREMTMRISQIIERLKRGVL